MLEIASQMILCLLLAALIGAIIGYIFGKSTCDDDHGEGTETVQPLTGHAHDTHASVASTAGLSVSDNKPVLLSGPRNGQKDNLTRIKGVGLKIEEALNEIGIYHFGQIAGWDEENISWADSSLGFPGRANREQWVSQAQALADGEETEFSKRVDAGEVDSSKQS